MASRKESKLINGWEDAPAFYFDGSPIAEEGFEWELRTNGGIIEYMHSSRSMAHQLPPPKRKLKNPRVPNRVDFYQVDRVPSTFEQMIVSIDFPSRYTANLYNSSNSVIGVRGEPLDPICMGWNVRAFDIYRLSQQDYWDIDVKLIGIKALHPTRRTGYRYVSAEDGYFNPHKAVMVEEDRVHGRVHSRWLLSHQSSFLFHANSRLRKWRSRPWQIYRCTRKTTRRLRKFLRKHLHQHIIKTHRLSSRVTAFD